MKMFWQFIAGIGGANIIIAYYSMKNDKTTKDVLQRFIFCNGILLLLNGILYTFF